MKMRLVLAFILLLSAIKGRAQFDTAFAKKNMVRCGDSLCKAFKSKNWDLYSRYTNPAIIGTLGGKEEFSKLMLTTFATIPAVAWKVYKPGKVLQVIKLPHEMQGLLELNSVLEWEGKRVSSTAYLVAQSWDGGLNWTFFDSQSDAAAAKTIKPDISPELVYPPRKEKVELIDDNGNLLPPPAAPKKKKPASKRG